MAEALRCITTKKSLCNDTSSAKFKCPSCNDHLIARSGHSRKIAAKYTCPKCGFEGPN